MNIIFTLLISSLLLTGTGVSMSGIHINDPKKALNDIKLEVVAREQNMVKYRTENGNDFSVTTDKGKVVYMENDWLQDKKGRKPLYSDFEFGKTSLKDIRSKFGTNGFAYRSRGSFATETDVIQFNCFEFDSPGNEILVTISKVSLGTPGVTEENVAEYSLLDAMIIADKQYLDDTWGAEKVFDPNYKKIKP